MKTLIKSRVITMILVLTMTLPMESMGKATGKGRSSGVSRKSRGTTQKSTASKPSAKLFKKGRDSFDGQNYVSGGSRSKAKAEALRKKQEQAEKAATQQAFQARLANAERGKSLLEQQVTDLKEVMKVLTEKMKSMPGQIRAQLEAQRMQNDAQKAAEAYRQANIEILKKQAEQFKKERVALTNVADNLKGQFQSLMKNTQGDKIPGLEQLDPSLGNAYVRANGQRHDYEDDEERDERQL